MAEHDLVIRGGVVVDGTGSSRRSADVAVSDGRITEVGKVSGRGHQEIEADGAIVAPGFVDIHTHYDGQATWDQRLQPSSWHGVTTVVSGNCGVGFAPAKPADRQRLIDLMEGIEDIPGTALHEGLPWTWQSFDEFLTVLEGRRRDIDLAVQVPHAAIRVGVMGDRAFAGSEATADDIATMADIVRRGVEAGALGFSTSRTLNHKTLAGDLTPSYDAGSNELVGIATEMGKARTGVLQLVTDFHDVGVDVGLMRAMVEASGRPLSTTLVQSPLAPGTWREVLGELRKANADGLPIRGQVAARGVGFVMGTQTTLCPFMTNPVWREFAGLTQTERIGLLSQPEVKRRVLAAQTAERDRYVLGGRLVHKYGLMYELTDPPNYEPDATMTIAARAEREGRTPEDLVYDILVSDDGRGMVYVVTANYADGDFEAVREMLVDDNTVPGLSDGGAHVGSICDGSFPTTLLQYWVRDRPKDRLSLEFVIQRQARDTARCVGLFDRGVIAPGYRADLNVIDMDGLTLHRPEVREDLPAGGRRMVQRADGYRHTIVAGQETYRDGVETDALPGSLIRGSQPAPVG
jgi:N-acyl-D-aspartate/D-glutamate deacylase